MNTDPRFGLVREAPPFLIWRQLRRGDWQVEGGAATIKDAQKLARRILGTRQAVILARGEHPAESVASETLRGGLTR
ncbi:MAG: hypothetical protein FJ271_28495 [Planctomycetes bacterium]|nr:hypothetical protein [Planctomycetota bacterium]